GLVCAGLDAMRFSCLVVAVVACLSPGCTPSVSHKGDAPGEHKQAKEHEMKNAPKVIPAKRPEDFWPLAGRVDNTESYSWVAEQPIHIVRAKDGSTTTLKDLKNTVVIFCTPWEPHSATKIGKLKKALDGGEKRNFAIVFVEGTAEQLRDTKAESWYFGNAYV